MSNPSPRERRSDALSFWEHIAALRRHALLAGLALVAGAIATHTARYEVIELLLRPVAGEDMQFLSPLDPLLFVMKLDLFGGLLLAAPVILWATLSFVAPALGRRARRRIAALVVIGLLLGLGAAAYALVWALPLIIKVLGEITVPDVETMLSASRYLDFAITVVLLHVLLAQIPIGVIAAVGIGVVSPRQIAKRRRAIYLALLIGLAVLTPTADLASLLLVFIPSVVLFETGLVTSRMFRKRSYTSS